MFNKFEVFLFISLKIDLERYLITIRLLFNLFCILHDFVYYMIKKRNNMVLSRVLIINYYNYLNTGLESAAFLT